jgi:hypothetical protein
VLLALDDAVDAPLFRVLGALQVGDGQECRIPPGRQQIVLAILLLEANHVVSIDKMIDAIWEIDPPETARKQVQICVSRVRGRLIAAGYGETIATRSWSPTSSTRCCSRRWSALRRALRMVVISTRPRTC